MDNILLRQLWRQALAQGKHQGELTSEERDRILDPNVDRKERGRLLVRMLASPRYEAFMREQDTDIDVDDLLRAEASLTDFLQDLHTKVEQQDAPPSWRERFSPLLERFRELVEMTPPEEAPNFLRSTATAVEALRLLTPVGEVPVYPYTFVWTPCDGATAYRVEFFDENLEKLWSTETTFTEIPYPAELPPPSAGQTFTWRVSALGTQPRQTASARVNPVASNGNGDS